MKELDVTYINDMMEHIKKITLFGHTLYVSDNGDVWKINKHNGHIIKPSIRKTHNGYLRLNLKGNGVCVHRLVYTVFVGKIPKDYEIDHINTIRTDNSVRNLRACTAKENRNNPLTLYHYRGNKNSLGFKHNDDYCEGCRKRSLSRKRDELGRWI